MQACRLSQCVIPGYIVISIVFVLESLLTEVVKVQHSHECICNACMVPDTTLYTAQAMKLQIGIFTCRNTIVLINKNTENCTIWATTR